MTISYQSVPLFFSFLTVNYSPRTRKIHAVLWSRAMPLLGAIRRIRDSAPLSGSVSPVGEERGIRRMFAVSVRNSPHRHTRMRTSNEFLPNLATRLVAGVCARDLGWSRVIEIVDTRSQKRLTWRKATTNRPTNHYGQRMMSLPPANRCVDAATVRVSRATATSKG